jgi:Sec-independent protein secretion pathway component TatC
MFKWAFSKIVKLREKVAVDLGDGDVEKPFLDHLEDLRTMIVRMCVTLLVVTVITFFFCEDLLKIIEYPLTLAGIKDKITLQNLHVTGGFMTAMNVSLVAGVVLAFPLLLYFLLQFILPGLRSTEKKVVFPALGVGAGLFLIGVVFSYYMVAPRALQFFYEFSVSVGSGAGTKVVGSSPPGAVQQTFSNGFGVLWERKNESIRQTVETSVDGTNWTHVAAAPQPQQESKEGAAPGDFRYVRITCLPTAPGVPATASSEPAATITAVAAAPFIWELTDYVKFLCQFILIFGACFELPVVVMALVKLDVLNYKMMKGTRSWAAVIIAVVAAVITPTQDALTLSLLAVPMYVLYEICIWLAWWMEKKDRQLYPEYYKDQDADAKQIEVADDWDNESYNPFNQDDDDEEASSTSPAKPDSPPAGPPASAESSPSSEPASVNESGLSPESVQPPDSPPAANADPDSAAKPTDDEPDVEKRDTD